MYLFRSLFVFMLFFALSGRAQEPLRYIKTGLGWSFNIIRDQSISPLNYSGSGIAFISGHLKEKEKSISSLELLLQTGRLMADINPDLTSASVVYVRTDINYRYLRLMARPDTVTTFYIGGGLLTKFNIRQHLQFGNNAFSYEYANSLSLEGFFNREFYLLNHQSDLNVAISAPVFSWLIYPAYASSLPEGYYEYPHNYLKAVLASGKWVSFNRYFRLNLNTALQYYLNNGNAFRLSYLWDLYRIDKQDKVISGSHGLILSMLFNF